MKRSYLEGIVLFILLILATPAQAWERLEQLPVPPVRDLKKFEEAVFNQAVSLMVAGQNDEAKQSLEPLAETGVTDAQVALGSLLMHSSAKSDAKEAHRYMYFAAFGGDWKAQLVTSNAFRDGRYTGKDYERARHWLKRAAVEGDAALVQAEFTQLNDTVMGDAVSAMEQAQYDVAEKLLRGLADENVVIAQEKLAALYNQGFLGSEKSREAEQWLLKAAQLGSQDAQYKLAMQFLKQPELSNEKRLMAVRMLEQAAKPGNAEAQYQLGLVYIKGQGTNKDPEKGVFYYRMAAEQGHVDAQYSLGVRHLLGEGVPKNDYEAHRWFREAADQGFARAMHNLALTYLYGIGTEKSTSQAEHWFKNAARDGVQKSNVFLSQGVTDDRPKFVKAAMQSSSPEPSARKAESKPAQKVAKKNPRRFETVKGADWFLNLPVKGYTIQVLSAQNPGSVDIFFNEYGIRKKEYLHYIDRAGKKPLHVIQYGFFNSKKDAMRAAKKMAKGKKGFKPWVRDVKTIRKKIVSL